MNSKKNNIRKQILEARSKLTPAQMNAAEEQALQKLLMMDVYRNSRVIMLYHDFRKEVPTEKLIAAVRDSGRSLILPLTDPDFQIIPYEIPKELPLSSALKTSPMGISEPDPQICSVVKPEIIDLVIVPGSAFDQSGNRMGYGKGCYDRFLPLLQEKAFKLGLAYEFQVLDVIPAEPVDVKMDEILAVSVE
jgi:5-formyltetrahydrofolate cyclo-ligase